MRARPVRTGVRQIGIPAFTTALLLAGAPVPAEAMPPVLPVVPLEQTTPVPPAAPPIAPEGTQPPPPAGQLPPLVPATPVLPGSPQTQTPPTEPDSAEQSQEADVLVTGRSRRGDPLEPFNAASFEATQAVDKAIVGPAAMAYEKGVPGPLRSGLRNFLTNLREPIVFFNFLLQAKIGKAGETAGRFLLNSTVGVLGVMDVAKRKPFNLPLRRNSFANTLGFYGVGTGPFFFLPLVGPTTLRDLAGTVMDQILIPIQPIRPSSGLGYVVPVGILSALDYRARIEPNLQRQRATGDPYAALRRDYLARRRAEIDWLRGRGPDPAATTAPAPR